MQPSCYLMRQADCLRETKKRRTAWGSVLTASRARREPVSLLGFTAGQEFTL